MQQSHKQQNNKQKIDFDIIVVGGGHAGLEAAHIAAKMGAKVHLLTILVENIALASCNPAIGGLGKGHLVKEIDALGGVMGQITDKCGIQYRTLNASKGPAVRGTRAQIDMDAYRIYARNLALNTPNLTISQEMACEILLDSNTNTNNNDFSQKDTPTKKAIGIRTNIGKTYYAHKIIITTGTFLRGLVHIGETQIVNGRFGESASNELSESLKNIGLKLGRLKTGTCPRIDGRSIDFSALEKHLGDSNPPHFSYHTSNILADSKKDFKPLDLPCFVTYTNEKTHNIIRKNFHRAPLFTGQIEGVGPRYCPSIEDKINRFANKERHQLFLEPQTKDCVEYYINGLTTSLPVDVQEQVIHSIKGLENARITRYGYAIEYDYVEPTQLKHTLECKEVDSLYLAGQINGTTGYEEAGALGLMAGINATLSLGNSPAGSHCIDLLDFEDSQATQPSSPPKSSKNSTSTTLRARIVESSTQADSSLAKSSLRDLPKASRGNLNRIANDLQNTQLETQGDCYDLPLANLAMTEKERDCHADFNKSARNDNSICRPCALAEVSLEVSKNKPLKELIFSRDESYIGVMIDDLVTKGTKEPYRLFTSRAEYRLLLREDNAIYRLLEYANALGSISRSDYEMFAKDKREIAKAMEYLESIFITPSKRVQNFLASINQSHINDKTALVHIVGRDGFGGDDFSDFLSLEEFLKNETKAKDSSLRSAQNLAQEHSQNLIPPTFCAMSNRALHQVQILAKYHNYIKKQLIDVTNMNEMLKVEIPRDFDYNGISGLSLEVVEKLSKARPTTLFGASQISGITPASLDVLHLYIHLRYKNHKNTH